MGSQAIENPLPTFTGLNGQPLTNGYVYFGEPDQDPREYPITVYYDEALTIPANQPLRTNSGYLYRNGSPTRVWVNGNYSTLVLDSTGRQVYYAPDWSAASSANITFLQAGTGAVLRDVQSKERDLVSVKDFGAVGDGTTDDTAAIQAAINTGFSLVFPSGVYRANGLTGSTAEQRFVAVGNVRLKKNAGGILLLHSGRDVEFNGLVFDGVASSYTSHNVVTTGDHPRFVNCGSRDAAGLALWGQGNACEVIGTNQIWQTADTSGSGFDIQCGVAGTTTLYHFLSGVYTSQATGGIQLLDTGSHTIMGGQFGKLNIQNTGAATVNGGKTVGARILGAVNINTSSAVFSGNQFGAVAIAIGGIDPLTSGCVLDRTNVYQTGCTIVNSGNANNVIERQTSAGSKTTIQYGGDAGLGSMSVTANTGLLEWSGDVQLSNNKALRSRNAADSGNLNLALIDTGDNVFVGSGVPAGSQGYYFGGNGLNLVVAGATRWFMDTSSLRPNADNAVALGSGATRPTELFAVTGTVNTSDIREKQDIGDIPDAWLDAWGTVPWRRYKWKDAVDKKGDGARWHFGVMAQEVKDAFEKAGIDPFAMGLLCFDEWDDIKDHLTGQVTTPAGNRYGIRYQEAEALEAAWVRRALARL